ncbi:MAG: PorT family protein [Flavobacteriaceae bacterium]|nr:PorT family protein [Flavobacteriaceae bacterium]
MTKKIAICVSLLFTGLSFGQEFSYGAKFGAVVSDLITDRSGMNVRTTVQVGGEAEWRWNNLSFQPELMYSRQGEVERGVTQDGARIDNTLKLDYMIMPLMGKYYFNEGFYAEAGPQVGYLLLANYRRQEGSLREVTNVRGNYSNFDLSGNIGLGYLTDWGFSVGLRYSMGFFNILEVPTENTTSQRNSVYQFYMGMRF